MSLCQVHQRPGNLRYLLRHDFSILIPFFEFINTRHCNKMADPLSLLRQYNVQRKEILEKDDYISFDEFAFPKTAKTNYIIYRQRRVFLCVCKKEFLIMQHHRFHFSQTVYSIYLRSLRYWDGFRYIVSEFVSFNLSIHAVQITRTK